MRIDNGNVIVSPTEAEEEPLSVTRLKDAIGERLPNIHLTDLLIAVDRWVNFRIRLIHTGGQNPTTDGGPAQIIDSRRGHLIFKKQPQPLAAEDPVGNTQGLVGAGLVNRQSFRNVEQPFQ